MLITNTALPGLLVVEPFASADARGSFVKTFYEEGFASRGLVTQFAEEYYSDSKRRVLRGMHFQVPPHEHTKIVYCVSGAVTDALIDLRIGSPSYGQAAVFELDASRPRMLYIPPGLAHGFFVRSQSAVLLYKVTSAYSREHDGGVLWSSVPVAWPDAEPILSDRDRAFPALSDFDSPFSYRPEGSR